MSAGRRCLILGGTGHIGNAFLRALLQGGHEASTACRRDGERPNLHGLKIKLLVGDDRKTDQLARWVRGHDLVIDAAAPYPLRLVDPRATHHQQVETALQRCRRLIDAVEDADAELIHVSSFTTLRRERPWHGRLQSFAVQGSHPYFETKATIERAVLQAAAGGLRAVVVNPSVCLGPYDLKPKQAAFVAAVARGELWGVTTQPLNVIDVRDVADLALEALSKKIYGRPIALSGHNTDLASLVHDICRLAGRQPPLMQGSTRLAAAGAWWTELAASTFGRAESCPSLPFLLLCECHAAAPSRLQQGLGLSPRPLGATLGDALRWYQSIGYC
ncbi:MAG: NAD-dependent epimerase/dehydratase family protein [Alphaproteobacteria bacterium]